MDLLHGKNAVVTGAARGIGLAIAQEFFKQGANVLLTDVNEKQGKEVLQRFPATSNNRVLFRRLDVTNETEVESVIAYAAEEFGNVDTLVNNAAIMVLHEVKDFPTVDWQNVFDVNITGAFLCAKVAVNHMIQNGIKGSILNVASASCRKADAKHAAYSASKAALLAFARVLSLEVGRYGIRVNSVLPGATETEMLLDVFAKVPGLKEDIVRKTVLGHLAQPTDQANAAVFLCSDLARHITGEYLVVAGGEYFNP